MNYPSYLSIQIWSSFFFFRRCFGVVRPSTVAGLIWHSRPLRAIRQWRANLPVASLDPAAFASCGPWVTGPSRKCFHWSTSSPTRRAWEHGLYHSEMRGQPWLPQPAPAMKNMDVPTNLVDASANDYLISRKWLEGFLQRYTEHVPNKSRPVIGIEDVILRQPQVHWNVVHDQLHKPLNESWHFYPCLKLRPCAHSFPRYFFVWWWEQHRVQINYGWHKSTIWTINLEIYYKSTIIPWQIPSLYYSWLINHSFRRNPSSPKHGTWSIWYDAAVFQDSSSDGSLV